jgi:hypothetical protein
MKVSTPEGCQQLCLWLGRENQSETYDDGAATPSGVEMDAISAVPGASPRSAPG